MRFQNETSISVVSHTFGAVFLFFFLIAHLPLSLFSYSVFSPVLSQTSPFMSAKRPTPSPTSSPSNRPRPSSPSADLSDKIIISTDDMPEEPTYAMLIIVHRNEPNETDFYTITLERAKLFGLEKDFEGIYGKVAFINSDEADLGHVHINAAHRLLYTSYEAEHNFGVLYKDRDYITHVKQLLQALNGARIAPTEGAGSFAGGALKAKVDYVVSMCIEDFDD